MATQDRRGIALILVSALLTLFSFLGIAFVRNFRLEEGVSTTRHQRTSAELVSASGMEYAATRIWRDSPLLPVARSVENRGDDWTARSPDGSIVGASEVRLANPSYARGERFRDSDGDGAYTPGVDSRDPASDFDGDGRLDAWSGRMRGGRGWLNGCFSLWIHSDAGRVCVNSGELGDLSGDQDMDGILNRDDTDYGADMNFAFLDDDGDGKVNAADADYMGPMGNGVPDWQDPDFEGNRHLVNLLDNLGAVLGLSDTRLVPYAPSPPAEGGDGVDPEEVLGSIEASSLGRMVVSHRPRGGYLSLDALARLLPREDFEKAVPFLGTRGEIRPIPLPAALHLKSSLRRRLWEGTLPERYEFHAVIDLNKAPREVIESALRHLAASGAEDPVETEPPFVRLLPAEARRLSELIARIRPVDSWKALLTAIHADPFLFETDPFLADVGATDPVQVLAKQDLVLAQFDVGWLFGERPLRRRSTLDVPRDAVGADAGRSIVYGKGHLAGFLTTAPYALGGGDGGGSGKGGPGGGGTATIIRQIPSRITTEFVLSSADDSFSVVSTGGEALNEGRISLGGGAVVIAGQQLFDPLLGFGGCPAELRLPGGEVRMETLAGRQGIQSHPRFPFLDGRGGTNFTYDSSWTDEEGGPGYPAHDYRIPGGRGWLQLAAVRKEGGVDTTFLAPFNEDGLPGAGYRYDPSTWVDNLYDPVDRPISPSFTVTPNVFEGTQLSPFGLQQSGTVGDYGTSWECGWNGVYPFSPFSGGVDGLREGTVLFWVPTSDVQDMSGGVSQETARVRLLYASLDGTGSTVLSDFLSIDFDARAEKATLCARGVKRNFLHPWWGKEPAEQLKETGWRCVAVAFAPDASGKIQAFLYVDGVLASTTGFALTPLTPAPADPHLLLRLASPVDDVELFGRRLTDLEILDRALAPRCEGTGRYLSSRVRFEKEALPFGVRITGFAWGGFVPPESGGGLQFKLSGYGETGEKVGEHFAEWSGTGTAAVTLDQPLDGCRSFDWELTITTAPTLAVPDSAGKPVLILRDSPLLEEFRLFYRGGRGGRWAFWE